MKNIVPILLSLVFLAIFFSLPIWTKSGFIVKKKKKAELLAEKKSLIQQNTFLDQKLNTLSKPSRIESKAAELLELSWGSRPFEVDLP